MSSCNGLYYLQKCQNFEFFRCFGLFTVSEMVFIVNRPAGVNADYNFEIPAFYKMGHERDVLN